MSRERIEERVYFKGKYYRRITSFFDDGPPCQGCVFDGIDGCIGTRIDCIDTGCGPTSIFKEDT